MTEGPSAKGGDTMACRRAGLGLAEDIFNWMLHVKSIYMSYKLIRWYDVLSWIYSSKQRDIGGEREKEMKK